MLITCKPGIHRIPVCKCGHQICCYCDCIGNERVCLSRVRTNSCQSDSSGFLEEPFVPSYPIPGPELMKVRLQLH